MSLDDPVFRARLALQLLAIDPGLGGLTLRARTGPVRDALIPCGTRLHPAMTDAALYGGIDLAATLSSGELVQKQGLLWGNRPFILTMAERVTPGFAARLALFLDVHPAPLILLDEGAEPDETAPATLTERLAFHVDLTGVPVSAITDPPDNRTTTTAAHRPEDAARLTTLAATLGIQSLRAPLFALRAAKAHAALHGRIETNDDDLAAAAALTLTHRALHIPDDAPQPEPDAPDAPPSESQTQTDIPEDLVLDAVRALLPDDLLSRLAARQSRSGRGNGTGAKRRGNHRGRPLPARPGRLSDQTRIDLVATLRAAAPWQAIRRRETGRAGLQIRASDIHVRRFDETSDRLLIFTVDASGSAALARLAEAKGAVELLLSQAYARRDHVALIAFRGDSADLLLPPTRSLVQTKRRLAALPGGGGTPLSAGLDLALQQALQARGRGMTPTVCLLTDGRANIARDGRPDRAQAGKDAEQAARVLRGQGIDAVVIDTGNRPSSTLRTLAQTLDSPYLALPRADAHRMADAVAATLAP